MLKSPIIIIFSYFTAALFRHAVKRQKKRRQKNGRQKNRNFPKMAKKAK